MNKPVIFGETVNKKTASRNRSTIPYERGMLSQEDRVFVESVVQDIKGTKIPSGYDGSIIKKEFIDFESEFPGLIFKKVDFLYDRMMNDARNVFPRNRELKNKVAIYYEEMIRKNLNNLYHFAPKFFTDNFVTKNFINNAAFELYQVYIFLLCFIHWTDQHRLDTDVRDMDNIDKILNWIATRRDPSIEYIINGPSANADLATTDFRSHYKTLIDTSNEMSEIIAYNQLSSTQTISSDLYNLLHLIQNLPNVYYKNPDEARKYNINIDSAQDVLVSIDNDNNLIFDCSYVNLGDVTEQNKLAKFENLESVITNNKVNSMINTKKLAELFHNYSRIKILELIVTPDTYISSLDAFNKVFVVFKGVSCSERNVYNTIPTNYLKIGGKFIKTKRGYEFQMDVDAITYKSVLADVKSFEVYLTLNPNYANQIIPNEYALTISKHKLYQHPITTDVIYDSKVRGIRKILTVRTKKSNDNIIHEGEYTIESDKSSINLSSLISTSDDNNQFSLVVNDRWSPSNDLRNRLPIHASTNNPVLDACILGTNNKKRKRTFIELLTEKVKLVNSTRSSVLNSLNECIDFANNCRNVISNHYFEHFLLQTIKVLNNIRTSWMLDEKLADLTLKLTSSSRLDNDTKSEIFDMINSSSYIRVDYQSELLDIINEFPTYPELNTIIDSDKIGYKSITSSITHMLSYDTSMDMKYKYSLFDKLNRDVDLLTDAEITAIKKSAHDLLYAIGNLSLIYNSITVDKSLTDKEISQLVNAIKLHTQLSLESLYAGIYALRHFMFQNDEKKSRIANTAIQKIYTSVPLTDEEKTIITSAVNDYVTISSSVKESIKAKINNKKVLNDKEQLAFRMIVYRSIVVSDSLQSLLLQYAGDENVLYNHYDEIVEIFRLDMSINDINKHQISFYNAPIYSKEHQKELIDTVTNYKEKSELNSDIRNGNYTQDEINQLLSIANRYYAALPTNISFNPLHFVAIMNILNNSQVYDIDDPLKYYFNPVLDDKFTQFFTNVTNNINTYINDIPSFIQAYEDIRTYVATINTEYMQYFNKLLNSITDHDITSDLSSIYVLFSEFKSVYNWLYRHLLNTPENDKDSYEYDYRNVEVDLNNGTIDGKYFTVDDNGFVSFDNVTTPDPDYLIYSESENDLMLMNLYTKYNETIKPIVHGSFIYSESLKTIQNLSYPLYDYTGYQNKIKFDNDYHIVLVSEPTNKQIYYQYYDSSVSFLSQDLISIIEATMTSTPTQTERYVWNENKAEISKYTITFTNPSENQPDLDYFEANCTVSYEITTNTTDEEYYSITADCVFIKLDDPVYHGYTTADNVFRVSGIIRSATWLTVTSDMVVHFIYHIDSSSAVTIEQLDIEPSSHGVVSDTTIIDSFNNRTNISEYFNITFVNDLGFSTLSELIEVASSSENTTVEDLYTVSKTVSRNDYLYTIKYIYNKYKSYLEIQTTIEKGGVVEQYAESVMIYLNTQVVHRDTVIINPTDKNEWSFELLRLKDNSNSLVTYIDTYHFGQNVKYTDKLSAFSNEYKAFYIDGIDVKANYWNKTSYVQSLMLCPLSTCDSKSFPESDYTLFTGEIYYNGQTGTGIIYNYDNGFTRFTNKFKINADGIYVADDETNSYVKSIMNSIFVNKNNKLVCSTEPNAVIISTTGEFTTAYYLSDDDHNNYYKITLTIANAIITSFVLEAKANLYDSTNTSDEWFEYGTIDYPVASEQPVYLFYEGNSVEVIISYDVSFADFPTTKNLTINSIAATTTKYETIHYVVDDNSVKSRIIDTVKYSNIPGDYCDESDIVFSVLGQEGMIFKYNPIFKYYENIIVSPRHVDQNNNFIMIAEKYNQNVLGKPVYLRSQYNLNNTSNNTIRDSDSIDYKIAQKLDPNKTHLMESVNKQMLMFGGVENNDRLANVAIKAAKVHAIPTASKLLMSLEFS